MSKTRHEYYSDLAWQTILDAAAEKARPFRHSDATRRLLSEKRIETIRGRAAANLDRLAAMKLDRGRAEWARWRAQGFVRWHILAAMTPGEWYGTRDIANASGVNYNSVKGMLHGRFKTEGLTEGFKTDLVREANGRRVPGPVNLWSLTEAGIVARKQALHWLEFLDWPSHAPKKEPASEAASGQGEPATVPAREWMD